MLKPPERGFSTYSHVIFHVIYIHNLDSMFLCAIFLRAIYIYTCTIYIHTLYSMYYIPYTAQWCARMKLVECFFHVVVKLIDFFHVLYIYTYILHVLYNLVESNTP